MAVRMQAAIVHGTMAAGHSQSPPLVLVVAPALTKQGNSDHLQFCTEKHLREAMSEDEYGQWHLSTTRHGSLTSVATGIQRALSAAWPRPPPSLVRMLVRPAQA